MSKWMKEISREARPKPSAVVMYGPPGIGKTSFGAATRKPIFMLDNQEDGLNTLKASGLLDAGIPSFPPVAKWDDVISQLNALRSEEHDYGTLVIDTIGGLERLCHKYVCERDFKGVWGEKGFGSYQQGFEQSIPVWRSLIDILDSLRTKQKMMIFMLSHSIIRPYKNPVEEDYDRFVVDLHHKTWAVTQKWADMVLFANYFVAIDKGQSNKQRAKGKGGKERVMHTEFDAAYDAKNRHNLPESIPMGGSGKEAWDNLLSAIKEGKKTK